ncbi:MAG: DNA polymerase [Planctomycetota bacterium]|nr:DNA polymerase [Planctomycetota bacterium]
MNRATARRHSGSYPRSATWRSRRDATKTSHKHVRDQFKVCALAVQYYGMAEQSLALKLGQSQAHARQLLQLHRQTYPNFWQWSENAVMYAMLHGKLHTTFGWQVRGGTESNPRSLANFPVQANGAEMLRLACSLATEAGVTVCAPVHDAVLIEGPASQIETVVEQARQAMAEASRIVLKGFEIRTDVVTVRAPDRYVDDRGKQMWETINQILNDISADTIREQ